MSKSGADLTISAVAERTSLSIAVLRAWESRFGFPRPDRLPGGHRRYTDRQVDQIVEVVRLRNAGMVLGSAIENVAAQDRRIAPSIYAEVRRRWPEQPVHVLTKRAMLALSRAIEDECLAQADHPVLIGCFQRERFYRRSQSRWRELARTAASATVFADFVRDAEPSGAPSEVAVPQDRALLREWAVVCDGPHVAACVLGVERAGSEGAENGRTFEAIWSVEPDLVRDAAEVGARLDRGSNRPQPPARSPSAPDPSVTLRRATAITNRAIAYLDR